MLGAGQPWQHPPVHALHHGGSSSRDTPVPAWGVSRGMGTSQGPGDTHLCFSSVPGQVSELVKVSTMSSPKIVLAITDLSLPLGRRVAAKAIAAL